MLQLPPQGSLKNNYSNFGKNQAKIGRIHFTGKRSKLTVTPGGEQVEAQTDTGADRYVMRKDLFQEMNAVSKKNLKEVIMLYPEPVDL